MAISHGRSLYFAISTPSGGAMTAFNSTTQEVSGLPGEQDLGDVTVAGNLGHTMYPGLQKASFTSKHTFDTATSGTTIWSTVGPFQNLQQTYPSTPWGIQFGARGSTAGYPLITCNAWIKSVAMPIKVTDPNLFTINWEMTAGTSGMTIGVLS